MVGSIKTIIVEYGFLDSEHDSKLLNTKKGREKLAETV
jgi:N-acetylmuramoyl-L-alanine amidase